jgi:2-polyprenyl-6-methoxyphenol hydroxylase-like FAD-dependent oxidoreductase
MRIKTQILHGAGISGMAAATALGRRVHNVTVFEDAPQIGEARYESDMRP